MTERVFDLLAISVAIIIGCLVATGLAGIYRYSDTNALTVLVGLATVLQALFAALALDGLRHARGQADAARASLALMDDTAKRQLRAYVDIGGVSVRRTSPDHSPVVTVRLQNSGQTPAYKLNILIALGLWEMPGPEAHPDFTPDPNYITLGSGQLYEVAAGFNGLLNAEDKATLDAGGVYTLSGYVSYVDAFDQPRFTRFHLRSVTTRDETPAMNGYGPLNDST